ncbi:AC3 [Jatropha yellow mosaic virus]|uniref:Replication enhancer n=1 Tax=Jatropha yellow mosaic virus TaxID=1485012 RepID=B6DXE6_9GEMI|nr:AC3 [Jatropha yellow mosaic virus]ACI15830.2 AC3 [Jatropha yellow mosaic virus]
MDSRTGEPITAARFNNGVFIWTVPNPLYFRVPVHMSRPFHLEQDIIHIQIQFNHNLRQALQIHKCFLSFKVWTRSRIPTGSFLRVFKTQVIRYLDRLGVISINLVIRAVDHVLYNVLHHDANVEQSNEIIFRLY